jgi:hypothetical protein
MEENKKHAPPRHCPVTGCEYKVQRKSRLRDHLQKEHNWSPEGIMTPTNKATTLSILIDKQRVLTLFPYLHLKIQPGRIDT